jgi:peptide/nickel transport system permease protein
MRSTDGLLAFPETLLALALVAALGASTLNIALAISVVNVAFFTRWVRSLALTTRGQPYVDAARALGAADRQIMARHLLPNIIPACFVALALNVGWMMIETAGLSFLGLGTQPPTADWGTMLADGRNLLTVAPHMAAVPGLAIAMVVLSCNTIADAARDKLDPRLRPR